MRSTEGAPAPNPSPDPGDRDEQLVWFRTLADNTSNFVGIADHEARLLYVNRAGMAMIGRPDQDPRELSVRDLCSPADFARFGGDIRDQLLTEGRWEGAMMVLHADGRLIPAHQLILAIRGDAARPLVFATIVRDLSMHRRVDALERSVQVLSAPILQVWDGVLALPVIGLVDSERAAQMTAALLEEIVQTGCRVAIIDLTGVDVIDTSTVAHLFKMVSAASLLGSTCVVSGISGAVAQTVSQLGVDLSHLQTFRTLRDGLRFALRTAGAGR